MPKSLFWQSKISVPKKENKLKKKRIILLKPLRLRLRTPRRKWEFPFSRSRLDFAPFERHPLASNTQSVPKSSVFRCCRRRECPCWDGRRSSPWTLVRFREAPSKGKRRGIHITYVHIQVSAQMYFPLNEICAHLQKCPKYNGNPPYSPNRWTELAQIFHGSPSGG